MRGAVSLPAFVAEWVREKKKKKKKKKIQKKNIKKIREKKSKEDAGDTIQGERKSVYFKVLPFAFSSPLLDRWQAPEVSCAD